MQLYKTLFTSAASNVEQERWDGSQAEASKTRGQLKRDGYKVIGTQTIDVPTRKMGILEWLNENAKT